MASNRTPLLAGSENEIRLRKRKHEGLRRILKIVAFISLPICTIFYLRWRRAVVPDVIDHDFGIGFDLTSPYGTAAISYPNGTIVNIAQIYGSQRYQAMMSRLSLKSSEHLSPPYTDLSDGFNDQPREAFRSLRKKMGLPASSDVGELASMMLSLRSAVELYLGGKKISGAVPTIPHLAALYGEDLEDAFEYIGLLYIPRWPFGMVAISARRPPIIMETDSGCARITQISPHVRKKRADPLIARMSFAGAAADEFMVTDFGLGCDRRHDNPNEDYYWEAVRDTLIKPALIPMDRFHGLVDKVLVRGDCSTDKRFQKVVREAVKAALEKNPEIFAFDPVFSAARGAAEMAKQVYWTYNHTKKLQSIENGDF